MEAALHKSVFESSEWNFHSERGRRKMAGILGMLSEQMNRSSIAGSWTYTKSYFRGRTWKQTMKICSQTLTRNSGIQVCDMDEEWRAPWWRMSFSLFYVYGRESEIEYLCKIFIAVFKIERQWDNTYDFLLNIEGMKEP